MNLLNEYKELYYKELEHNDRLNNKMGIHITFITVIATAEILLWKDVFLLPYISWWWIYIVLTSISLICFVITLFYFYKLYTGYKYCHINLQETKMYIDNAKKYAKQNNISSEVTENRKAIFMGAYKPVIDVINSGGVYVIR